MKDNTELTLKQKRQKGTQNMQRWRAKNKERNLENSRRWRAANLEKCLQYSKQWRIDNPDNVREWRKRNPDRVKMISKRMNTKRRSDLKKRLSDRISGHINYSLRRGSKAGRHWESLVNFTIDQLKCHLEKLFTHGMNWDNYGTVWEIDHKIPVAVFNFDKPEHLDFRLCWSLKNLQPLNSKQNQSKSARIDKPFQPALAIGIN